MNKTEKAILTQAFLETLPDEELVRMHNELCYSDGNTELCIYRMDEFNDFAFAEDLTAAEIAELIYDAGRQFNPYHRWFIYAPVTPYSMTKRLRSFDTATEYDSPVFLTEMANYMADHKITFGYEELEDIMGGDDAEC